MLSAIVSAAGSLLGGINAQAAYNQRAKQLRAQADQYNMEAGTQAMSYMGDAARQEASGFVSAASGGGVTGSAFDVLNDFAGTALYNARSIVYQGQTKARNALQESYNAKAEGQNALISSVFSAGSSLLGGFDAMKQKKAGLN
ncbi:virion core protein, T7 gp14 family [Asticcacaulis taihuensis]|uniref:virion core protein, T7 gp14 family n=1 Tax=Asticcacaulis taihuensis TaxID=260084 RepID=UPI0026EE0CDB|nr:hypothetical protein [Asticcacaulis taihuensis]